jgi:addiction module RelE/StbE family toxin
MLMIRLVYSGNFLKSTRQLPPPILKKLTRLLEKLRETPDHPLLHSKQRTGDLAGFFSFRITRDWRVMFQFDNQKTIYLLRVAHRKDMYR